MGEKLRCVQATRGYAGLRGATRGYAARSSRTRSGPV